MRCGTLILVVLVLAGCGGSAGVSGGGASLVPPTTDAFVALDTHLSASQWPAIDALLQRFPVQDPVLAQLQTLKVGREVDLVALGNSLVVLTPSSNVRLQGFASKRVGGWTAFARDATTLDAIGGKATTLASTRSYKNAIATLPGNALARAYAGPAAARHLLTLLPGQEQVVSVPFARRRTLPGRRGGQRAAAVATEQTVWAAAALVAHAHEVTLEAHARVQPPPASVLTLSNYMQIPVPPYPARLVDEIPADVLAVADFQIGTGELEATDPADLPAALRKLAVASPSLLNQLDTILGGETAIYARAGNELTLVTQPADTKAATDAVGAVAPLLHGTRLHVTVFGGELVVSTSQKGLAAFRGGGAKLSADAMFQKLTRAARLPETTTGFVYADLRSGSAPFAAIAPLFGLSVPKAPERALLLYETRTGRNAGSVLFLQAP